MAAFYDRLLTDLQTLPGVVSATTTSGVPLSGGNKATEIEVPGLTPPRGEMPSADWRIVRPGYFATMGIPLRGREFSPADGPDAPPYTIVSEALARRYWPNDDPIGKTIILRSLGNRPHTIVGVAGDVRSQGLETEPRPMVYYSAASFAGINPVNLVWRSHDDPSTHVNAIRELVRRTDPTIPLYDINSLESLLPDSLGPRRFNTYLLACFAAVAMMLAAVGLFGVMAYLVSQRRREIGVRLALGADRREIFRLILGRGLALASIGAAIGLGFAFWLTRAMKGLLFAVSTTDPTTFAVVPVVLVLVAVMACYVPARRAMRVDPLTALRAE
jgi:putative ABC transport system permease protein